MATHKLLLETGTRQIRIVRSCNRSHMSVELLLFCRAFRPNADKNTWTLYFTHCLFLQLNYQFTGYALLSYSQTIFGSFWSSLVDSPLSPSHQNTECFLWQSVPYYSLGSRQSQSHFTADSQVSQSVTHARSNKIKEGKQHSKTEVKNIYNSTKNSISNNKQYFIRFIFL
jgi:hypothetical protein